MAENDKSLQILLVDDNPGDVRLVVETLKEGTIEHRINVAYDGEEALEFLHRKGKYSAAPVPEIVLLDLKLPKRSGLEVLADMRKHRELKDIPVIVLTSSEAENDIRQAYGNEANCYVTKPIDLDRFIVTIKSIESFWVTIIKGEN